MLDKLYKAKVVEIIFALMLLVSSLGYHWFLGFADSQALCISASATGEFCSLKSIYIFLLTVVALCAFIYIIILFRVRGNEGLNKWQFLFLVPTLFFALLCFKFINLCVGPLGCDTETLAWPFMLPFAVASVSSFYVCNILNKRNLLPGSGFKKSLIFFLTLVTVFVGVLLWFYLILFYPHL